MSFHDRWPSFCGAGVAVDGCVHWMQPKEPRCDFRRSGGDKLTMEGVGLAWWKFSIKTTRSEGSALHAPPKRRLLRSIGLVSPIATAWMEEYREMGQALSGGCFLCLSAPNAKARAHGSSSSVCNCPWCVSVFVWRLCNSNFSCDVGNFQPIF